MSIYPTRTAAHLAIAGVLVFAVGIALREAVVVSWGGALLAAVALARAVTLVSVMRIRAAGFEMLWTGSARRARTRPGGVVTLLAEVRNRDTLSARYDKLRVVASPALQTWVEPLAGEVPATGSVKLLVHVRALRVGYHGIYGLALEVRGAPGLFEVPLTFANPYGIEVLPKALARPLMLPHGGRSRTLAMSGRAGRQRGEGTDLHELRELVPGDSFRRIAWKASAKRGRLVVKEFEREERDVVMIVVDCSVEHWSGPMGGAPLDRSIDLTASLAAHHLTQGDHVGLRLIGSRELCRLEPDGGRPQAGRVVAALLDHAGVLDVDRSGWDESDLAVQVTEHLRPLDPRAVSDLRQNRIDKLVARAEGMLSHAPFNRPTPQGQSPNDAKLRRYAACFGLHTPPRLEPDGGRTQVVLAEVFHDLARHKKRKTKVSIVHVVAPAPPESSLEGLKKVIRKLRGRGVQIRWTTPPVATPLDRPTSAPQVERDQPPPPVATDDLGERLPIVERVVVMRAALANRRGEQLLRRLGVKIVRPSRPLAVRQLPEVPPERDEQVA
ncbi:MAG: DUF58 domain-containing protein [Polyangiaceae bacterium]